MPDPVAHFEIYPEMNTLSPREHTGNYRWRFQAANGEIQAESGDGFRDRTDANRAIHDLLGALEGGAATSPHPPIIDVEE